ncbi:SpoIIE family protein phosphatase [Dactylosporangium sp. NPDC006015]|uniref:SpoIIE family protein phosphatase n=1 Tax=Dactylosporangium sp. NPDC006015 TaxID=3154576 RepID=UPI0033AEA0E8
MSDDADARPGDARTYRDRSGSPGPILVSYTGAELRVAAANAAFRAFVGNDSVVGRTARELFPEWTGQQIIPMLERVLATGATQIGKGWRVQIRDDGDGGMRDAYVDFVAEPCRDAGGTVVGVTGVGTDVTEQVRRRRAEQRRAAEAERRSAPARDVITGLQRHLLPPGLPVLPSARIAASYLPADAGDAAGGDWFDAVPLAGRRVALVVGDVAGHGVAAAATMGQLRAVMQDRLDETGDPVAAIEAADRLACRVPEAHAATVCVAVLDLTGGALTYCTAGHPPPLVVGPDTARYLPASGAGPLGTGARFAVATGRVEPHEVLLLYTDGIIERPGRTPAAATVELARVATDAAAGRGFDAPGDSVVDRVCTQTLELLVRETGHTDDVTLLAAGRRVPAPPLRLHLPAARSTTAVRDALTAWLAAHDAGEDDRLALAHAVVELTTNAYEHARPDTGDATVTLTADLHDDGRARIDVTDNGRWHERPRPGDERFREDHGLGLAMTAAFADRLDIHRCEHGTTATVHRRLSGSARLLTADQISHGAVLAAHQAADLMRIVEQPDSPGNRIAVHGPLDARHATELRAELVRRTLGGTHRLTVDLTGVTHLASAAVAELYRHRQDGSGPLRLYAPAGSTAHHVLTLINLPHTTSDPDLPGPGGVHG